MNNDIARQLIGTTVSVDVSTDDSNFDRRIFATIIGVQPEGDTCTLLAEEESRNFDDSAPRPGAVRDELRALARRYPKGSLERVRVQRLVRAYEEQERRIARIADGLRADIPSPTSTITS